MTNTHPYSGQRVMLASMHGKEKVLAPILGSRLGLVVEVVEGLDTDQFGTFTPETPRPGTMLDAARAKAQAAIKATGAKFALASEGSFGPHPALPYVPAARELLLFLDVKRGLEIVETHLSTSTNYNSTVVALGDGLDGFLNAAGFPEHALVVMPAGGGAAFKGITDFEDLMRAITKASALAPCGRVQLATDMRAHFNPTRMGEIARLAERLAQRLATMCAACNSPGFGAARPVPGLPCAACGTETEWARAVVISCVACGHSEAHPRPDGLTVADPAHCPSCNP